MGIDTKSIEQRWEALNNGESFFVPSIDPIRDRIFCLKLGYVVAKNPPEATVGIYRGVHGVLCFRKADYAGLPRGRKKSVNEVPPRTVKQG